MRPILRQKEILNQVLGQQADQLKLQFETDIQRTLRVITFEDAEIEISLDIGVVRLNLRLKKSMKLNLS